MTDLAPLFAGYPTLPAIVEAVLEGRQGSAVRAGDSARLTLGCYEVFGGDPHGPGARHLIETATGRELVYGNDPAWRARLLELRGGELVDRPMTEFDAGALDAGALDRAAAAIDPAFALRPLDEHLASRLDGELEPHGLQVFPSARDLARRGLGYAAVTPDGELAAAATSYTCSSRYLEVAIAARPAYRRRGLAHAVGAALVSASLARGLVPAWSASNPISKRLAARLGYRPASECEVLLRP